MPFTFRPLALELYNRDGMMTIDLSWRRSIPAARISASIISPLKARHGRDDFSITTQEDMLKTLSNIPDILTMGGRRTGQHFTGLVGGGASSLS
ncbi:MAG: hypothetical protein IPN64_13800 [Propionivibrio sp.]|uniref:hypothetical protein n=1 Tax=Propionivibrio sp. TaxID=2212460 RepID=UPI0025DF45EE|nr:hypothetical protein [Propionivibrio sp.]MBK8895058.1 hypothetical protein [Propionivibrio sp.]